MNHEDTEFVKKVLCELEPIQPIRCVADVAKIIAEQRSIDYKKYTYINVTRMEEIILLNSKEMLFPLGERITKHKLFGFEIRVCENIIERFGGEQR